MGFFLFFFKVITSRENKKGRLPLGSFRYRNLYLVNRSTQLKRFTHLAANRPKHFQNQLALLWMARSHVLTAP